MGPLHYKRRWMQPTARHTDLKKQTARAERKKKAMSSQMGLEPTIFGSGNRRLGHLATGTALLDHLQWDSNPQSSAPETDALSIWPLGQHCWITSSGTRTHNLILRRGAPYPLGHGGIKKSCCAHRTALYCIPDFQKQKTYAWSGVRTHADKRPADLKSAPLDPSGIQARNTRRPQVNEPKARAEP